MREDNVEFDTSVRGSDKFDGSNIIKEEDFIFDADTEGAETKSHEGSKLLAESSFPDSTLEMTDSDKKIMEEVAASFKIHGADAPAEETPKKKKSTGPLRMTDTKIKLIQDIKELSDKLGLEYDEMVLKTSKVVDLKKQLAALIERSAKVIEERNTEITERETGAKALFRFHSIMTTGLEELSIAYESTLGSNLKGYSAMNEAHRKELEEILGRIYMENREILKNYISPLYQYALLNIRMMSMLYLQNKKKISSEESGGSSSQRRDPPSA